MSLKRNTLWNLVGTGVPLLLGAVTIPYLIKKTGVEAFGVLTLVWALIGYFSLFDFGFGRALTQQVAAARSAGSDAQLPSLVKTGLWFTAATGMAGGLVLAALSQPLALYWLNVSVPLQANTYHALLIAAIGIPLTTVTSGVRGILEGFEDFKLVNLLRITLGAANFGLPALSVLLLGSSLVWMVLSLIVARAVVLVAHLWLVQQKLPPGWAFVRFNRDKMRSLLSFGAWMTVTNVIGPLMVTADRFVISAVLGASVVAYYTVPFEIMIRVMVVPGALTSALFPRLATLMSTDMRSARALYQRCLKLVTLALLPICLALAFSSKWGMTLWLGKDFAEHSWMIVCVMALGLLFNGIAYIPFAMIQAAGDARSTAHLHIFEFIIYLPLLLFALKTYGLIGAAIAWTFRVIVDFFILLILGKIKIADN